MTKAIVTYWVDACTDKRNARAWTVFELLIQETQG
jgi:hypothetical protein